MVTTTIDGQPQLRWRGFAGKPHEVDWGLEQVSLKALRAGADATLSSRAAATWKRLHMVIEARSMLLHLLSNNDYSMRLWLVQWV